ncbi:MAG TPA: biotin/lipoyl-containing protein, partial [Pseudolabrys sp.]|nr:biotin/lipoyl-containing protein [Pseudolabrys sp.]
MPTNILMPALSPTMEKGNLAKWLKKEGDAVKTGDVLAEIETDKATMEYEAVDDGTLAKIVVPEGTQDVAVNAVIAVLAGEGEDVKAAAASAGKAAAAPAAAPAKQTSAPSPHPAPAAPPSPNGGGISAPAAQPNPSPRSGEGGAAQAAPGGVPTQKPSGGRVFSSPLARRLAKEAGIDLSRVTGSGPHGRVVARDIADAKSGKGLAPAPAIGAPAGAPSVPIMSDQQVLSLFEEGSYE